MRCDARFCNRRWQHLTCAVLEIDGYVNTFLVEESKVLSHQLVHLSRQRQACCHLPDHGLMRNLDRLRLRLRSFILSGLGSWRALQHKSRS